VRTPRAQARGDDLSFFDCDLNLIFLWLGQRQIDAIVGSAYLGRSMAGARSKPSSVVRVRGWFRPRPLPNRPKGIQQSCVAAVNSSNSYRRRRCSRRSSRAASRQSKLLQQLQASSVQSPLLTCGVAGLCSDAAGATSFFRLAGRTVPVRAAT
jgi:hypothetical protein